ncbi:AraC family transcriptional regulator [Agrobacterium sp. T29]|uniref:AraC family transcriptional regulator n=1 Tax=Agrobacterium sp. T29 TaxID=2580515 RepID=UPI00115DEB1B|nr:AraC family transcriptional regulator [Agrobacterium sp. T29]
MALIDDMSIDGNGLELPPKSRPITPSHILFHLSTELLSRGFDLHADPRWRFLCELNQSRKPARVSFSQAEVLIQNALDATNDPNLGLAVGLRQSFGSLGLLSSALLSSPTLRSALAVGMKYHRLSGSLIELDQSCAENGDIHLSINVRHVGTTISRFVMQEFCGGFSRVSHYLHRGKSPFRHVSMIFQMMDKTPLEEAFACPVETGVARNEIVMSAEALDYSLETADAYALSEVIDVLEALTHAAKAERGFLEQTEQTLVKSIKTPPQVDALARQLGTSERTLRRRLNEAGTSYSELLEKLRLDHAIQLLHNRKLSVKQISSHVGFTDPRSLRRLMMDHVGMSASELRRRVDV